MRISTDRRLSRVVIGQGNYKKDKKRIEIYNPKNILSIVRIAV